MSSSPVDTSFFDEQALSQKQVIMMASKTVEMLEPNPSNVGYPPPPAPRNPVDLWTKAKRNITIRRKISQHFLPKSVSFFLYYLIHCNESRNLCSQHFILSRPCFKMLPTALIYIDTYIYRVT